MRGIVNISEVKMQKLWQNPNPTSSFEGSILLSSNDYDFLFFIVGYETANPVRVPSMLVDKGNGTYFCYGDTGRAINYVNDTTYVAANCYKGSNIDNNRLVPISVYGIKL